jgi:hypothetical protein
MPVGTHVIEAIAVDPIPRYIEIDKEEESSTQSHLGSRQWG